MARLRKSTGGLSRFHAESSLLEIFLARKTQVFSKSQLLDQLFGYNAEPTENNIEVLIARLRRKLVGTDVEITTQRGVGYRIVRSGREGRYSVWDADAGLYFRTTAAALVVVFRSARLSRCLLHGRFRRRQPRRL